MKVAVLLVLYRRWWRDAKRAFVVIQIGIHANARSFFYVHHIRGIA